MNCHRCGRAIRVEDLVSTLGAKITCLGCNAELESADKDYGPMAVGAILGSCIGSYIQYGVTRDELLELVGEMYDAIKPNFDSWVKGEPSGQEH